MDHLNIVYEDGDFVVVNKPAGMLTHPAPSHPDHTLTDALTERYPEMKKVGDAPNLRPGILHRLDRNTSGLIIAAKNQRAFLFLKEQFLNKSIIKKYLALVEGVPKQKRGVIEYAIRPSKKNWLKKVAVRTRIDADKNTDGRGYGRVTRTAKTEYEVLKTFGDKYSLLEVRPLTGRTHQIRVHLAAINHPVVGDALYGSKEKTLNRPFLHAYYLQFIRPSGQPIALETDLPEDLHKFLAALK